MSTLRVHPETLKESKLPEEKYNLLMQYICHERNFLYTFLEYSSLSSFPLLYMDRYKGWKYSEGGEPILASSNAFSDYLEEEVREYKMVHRDNIINELTDLFSKGHRAAVDIWLKHTDGTPYTTAILLEGLANDTNVYYTKINVTINRTYVLMDLDELKSSLSLDGEFFTKLTIIKRSQAIDELALLNPLEAFKKIFSDLYGFSFIDKKLYKNEAYVGYELDGFDRLIEYLENHIDEIITTSGVPKHHEIRLSRHIENKITPLQMCLQYILNTKELRNELSDELIQSIEQEIQLLNQKLKSLLKFASLLIQRPQESFFRMYLNALKDLRTTLPTYQTVYNEAIFTLANAK